MEDKSTLFMNDFDPADPNGGTEKKNTGTSPGTVKESDAQSVRFVTAQKAASTGWVKWTAAALLFAAAWFQPAQYVAAFRAMTDGMGVVLLSAAQAADVGFDFLIHWIGKEDLLRDLALAAVIVFVVYQMIRSAALAKKLMTAAAIAFALVKVPVWLMAILQPVEALMKKPGQLAALGVLALAAAAIWAVTRVMGSSAEQGSLHSYFAESVSGETSSQGTKWLIHLFFGIVTAGAAGAAALLVYAKGLPWLSKILNAASFDFSAVSGEQAKLLGLLLAGSTFTAAFLVTLARWEKSHSCAPLSMGVCFALIVSKAAADGPESLMIRAGHPLADIAVTLAAGFAVLAVVHAVAQLIFSFVLDTNAASRWQQVGSVWHTGQDGDTGNPGMMKEIADNLCKGAHTVVHTIFSMISSYWTLQFGDLNETDEHDPVSEGKTSKKEPTEVNPKEDGDSGSSDTKDTVHRKSYFAKEDPATEPSDELNADDVWKWVNSVNSKKN